MLIRSGEAEGRLEMSEIRLYKEENEDEIIRKLVEDKLRIYKKGYFPGVQYSILIDTKRHYVWYKEIYNNWAAYGEDKK